MGGKERVHGEGVEIEKVRRDRERMIRQRNGQ